MGRKISVSKWVTQVGSDPSLVVLGAVGPFPKALTRAVRVEACLVPRRVGWLRHRLVREEVLGFGCPVLSVAAYGEAPVWERVARMRPDLIVVAGFPRKLPATWVNAAARFGAINVHPSLLPRDRGPVPTFWALKRGDAVTGVTLHALTEQVDAGDIIAQAKMEVPFGGDGVRLLEKLGTLGGELVKANLQTLAGPWHMTPQGDDVGPWAHKPKHADFAIRAEEWTCKKLFHFVRGARAFGTPWAHLADETYYFAEALDYVEGRAMPGEFMVIGQNLMMRVQDGTVSFRLA